jgi:hypothetical protein
MFHPRGGADRTTGFGCNRQAAGGNCCAIPSAQTAGVKKIRKYSPYLLVELLLPGGTVIALLLWLFRRKFDAHAQVEQGVAAPARQ